MHMQEEVCFSRLCSHPMITVLTLDPVKAFSSTPQRKSDKRGVLCGSQCLEHFITIWIQVWYIYKILLYCFCSLTWTNLEKHK